MEKYFTTTTDNNKFILFWIIIFRTIMKKEFSARSHFFVYMFYTGRIKYVYIDRFLDTLFADEGQIITRSLDF